MGSRGVLENIDPRRLPDKSRIMSILLALLPVLFLAGCERRRLVILDLNKTLVHRAYEPRADKEGSFRVGVYRCEKRPHLDEFLSVLLDHPDRFEVGVWTSAMRKNGLPVAKALFGPRFVSVKFILTREDCSDVRNDDADHSSTKDLRKVWDLYPEYGPWNTVVIEDSLEKHPLHAALVWEVPPFSGQQQEDDALRRLAKRLMSL
jgi:NLI interacting factor-like phosphatase